MRLVVSTVFITIAALVPVFAGGQELIQDKTETAKAKVLEILSQEERSVPGTDFTTDYQTIRAEILDGTQKGETVTVKNDFLNLRVGELFYLIHTTNSFDGTDYYNVSEPYRLVPLLLLFLLFVGVTVYFGGIQGARGLLSLGLSLLFIALVLLPGVLKGYSPVLVAVGVSSLIIIMGSYVTHGFSRMTTTAVLGMIATVVLTGVLAQLSIFFTHLSGFGTEESAYLSINLGGKIDMAGLLLGGILIGTLGVLYDAAIGQSVAVEELSAAGPDLSRHAIYSRALRMGREHVGALVNTLAIAYVGVSLPLLLLFYGFGSDSVLITINREIFASEIVRTLVGSIGIILAVPITTAVAVRMLVTKRS